MLPVRKRPGPASGAVRLAAGAACALLLTAAPARAGYYELVGQTGTGRYIVTKADGTETTTNLTVTSVLTAPDGDLPPLTVGLSPCVRVDYRFTDSYTYQWVPDYPGEAPEDSLMKIEATITQVGEPQPSATQYANTGSGSGSFGSDSESVTFGVTPDACLPEGYRLDEHHTGDIPMFHEFTVTGATCTVSVTTEAVLDVALVQPDPFAPVIGLIEAKRKPPAPGPRNNNPGNTLMFDNPAFDPVSARQGDVVVVHVLVSTVGDEQDDFWIRMKAINGADVQLQRSATWEGRLPQTHVPMAFAANLLRWYTVYLELRHVRPGWPEPKVRIRREKKHWVRK